MLRAAELMTSTAGLLAGMQLRIGMHTGSAMAGAVGAGRPKYVLVGEAVSTGSDVATTATCHCIGIQ